MKQEVDPKYPKRKKTRHCITTANYNCVRMSVYACTYLSKVKVS
jgi:hypothetical protein